MMSSVLGKRPRTIESYVYPMIIRPTPMRSIPMFPNPMSPMNPNSIFVRPMSLMYPIKTTRPNLLPPDLKKECLFVLKKRTDWSLPFDASWTYKQIIAWGRHNAHAKLTPETVTKGSHAYALWRCGHAGHMWTVEVNYRGSRGNGCRACRGGRLPTGIGTLSPELRAECTAVLGDRDGWSEPFCDTWSATQTEEWVGLNKHTLFIPDTVNRSSHSHALWKCGEGHRWIATIDSRSVGHGCPTCENKRSKEWRTCTLSAEIQKECLGILKSPPNKWSMPFNKEWNAEQAKAWVESNKHANLTPQTVTNGSSLCALWECKVGHRWIVVIRNRSSNYGCPHC